MNRFNRSLTNIVMLASFDQKFSVVNTLSSFAWALSVMPTLKYLKLIRNECNVDLSKSRNCDTKSRPLEKPFWESLKQWPEGSLIVNYIDAMYKN